MTPKNVSDSEMYGLRAAVLKRTTDADVSAVRRLLLTAHADGLGCPLVDYAALRTAQAGCGLARPRRYFLARSTHEGVAVKSDNTCLPSSEEYDK